VFEIPAVLLALIASLPLSVDAQIRRPSWGVSFSGSPSWEVPGYQRRLFDADTVDLTGSEVSIGVVRGATLTGDWGVAVVRRSLARGSSLTRNDGTVLTIEKAFLYGVEVNGFVPFTTIRERVQPGLLLAAGVGAARGGAVREEPGQPATPATAQELFAMFGVNTPSSRSAVSSWVPRSF